MRKLELDRNAINSLINEGKTTKEIAKEFGVSASTVMRRKKELGIDRVGGKQYSLEDTLTEDYLNSVKDTHTTQMVADEINCSFTVVRNYCKKFNIELQKPEVKRGSDHANWKSGKHIKYKKHGSGKEMLPYEFTYVGYVDGSPVYKPTHRLVVEKELGYELPSNIDVHHVNGNSMDNRYDNLAPLHKTYHSKFHNILGSLDIDFRGFTKSQTINFASEDGIEGLRELVLDYINKLS